MFAASAGTRALDLRESKHLLYKRCNDRAAMPQIILDSYNLLAAERRLCVEALDTAGSIVDAAALLGITRHALKRRIIKLRIEWPKRGSPAESDE